MTHILFLCTGNTCRSPMAKCLMEELARKRNLPITCDSAGFIALPGAPASRNAQWAMSTMGLSLKGHHAKRLSFALAEQADVVLCMTEGHRREFMQRYPEQAYKAQVFSRPVPDPFGGSESLYLDTAFVLSDLIEEWARNFLAGK